MGTNIEQLGTTPKTPEILKSFDVLTDDGKIKHRQLRRMTGSAVGATGSGIFEAVYEETERGWLEIPFSECQIINEYAGPNGEKYRDIVYKKMVEIGRGQKSEQAILFFKASQEFKNDEWITIKEEKIKEKSNKIM